MLHIVDVSITEVSWLDFSDLEMNGKNKGRESEDTSYRKH
jgi:hypothetical protein